MTNDRFAGSSPFVSLSRRRSARRLVGIFILATVGLSGATAWADDPQPLYKQASAPVEQRVADLLGRMTMKEKIGQITGHWMMTPGKPDEVLTDENYAKLFPDGIGEIGPTQFSLDEDVRYRNSVQKFLREKTRLGIPAIFHDEGCHGVMKPEATSFPMPIGLACSWDEAMVEKIYDVVGREMRARGGQESLTPILDVARDPRWGRTEETMGEDPFLNGRLGAAVVRGLQGGSTGVVDGEHVMSTLKHFVGHGTPEGGLNQSPFEGGIRQLREVQLAPFEYVIKTAHPDAVMASYNEIDGVPSHANRWLLRGELGFTGLVVSDYSGVERLYNDQFVAADKAQAAQEGIDAGVQIELPDGVCYQTMDTLVQEKKVDMATVDEAVSAVLRAKFELGLFENPYVDAAKAHELVARPESRELSLQAARETIVLLKNEGHLLPLSTTKYHTIAVIGPNGDIARLGGYSGTPKTTVSLLDGIRASVGDRAKVVFAKGCEIVANDQRNSYKNWLLSGPKVKPASEEVNEPLMAEAEKTAEQADVVVLALGDVEQTCREAWAENHPGDRTSLDLPGQQEELARRILKTGKPVVLYLMNGRPPTLNDLGKAVPAIIEGWYAGEETGDAAADILFGKVSPSGKLTISFPVSVGQVPVYYSKKEGAANFDYLFGSKEPVYPFGYGLSYTTFAYKNLKLADATIAPDGQTTASVEVTNTGGMAADEIVELYVHDQVASVTRPVKELKGFQRIHLNPGETRTVTFPVEGSALAFYGLEMERKTEPGTYKIMVGPSSDEVESVDLTVGE